MGMIWTSKTRTRQPQGAIKPAAGLPLAYLGGTHNGWRNFANVAPTIPSGWSVTTDRFGIANACDGASTMAVSGQGLATDRKSIVILFKTGATASAFGVVMSLDDAGGANSPARIQYDASGVSLVYTVRDSVGNYQTPTLIASPALNTWYCVALSDNQASGVRVSINGSAAQSIAGYAKQYVIVAGLYVGGYGGSGANWTGKVALIGWSNNLLSDFQLQAYAANPWQLFAPEQTPKFYSLPAATSSGMIWTSKTRTRQPQGGIPLANWVGQYTPALVSFPGQNIITSVARQDMTYPPLAMAGTMYSGGSKTVSKNGPAFANTGAFYYLRANGTSDAYIEIPNGSDWTYVASIDNPVYTGSNPCIWRSSFATGNTFILFPSSGLWVRQNGTDHTSSVARPSDTTLNLVVVCRQSAGLKAWINGVLVISSGSSAATSGMTATGGIGPWASQSSGAETVTGAWTTNNLFWAALPDALAHSLSINPWQLFAPSRTPSFYSISSSGGGAGTKILIPFRRVWTRQPR